MSQAYADSAHPAGSASALFARGMAARSAGDGMDHAAAAAGAHCLQGLLMDSSSYSDLFCGDALAMGVGGGDTPLAFLEGFPAMEEEDMWSDMLPRVCDSLPDEYGSLNDDGLVQDSPMPDAPGFEHCGPGESTAIAGDLSRLALRGRDHHQQHHQLHHAVPLPSASPSACQPSLQSMMDIVGQDMEMDGMQQLSAGPDHATAAAEVVVLPEAASTTNFRRTGAEPGGEHNPGNSTFSQAEAATAAAIAIVPSSKSGGQRGGKVGQNQVNGSNSLQGKDSRWADQLLNQCAVAIATNNVVRTQHLMWVLNDLASLTGDANQRLAAYGLKALFCRVTGSGEATSSSYYNGLEGFNSLTPKAVHKAVLKFHDVSPWHQLVYTVANGALLEAFDGHSRIHVVDIGLSLGTQWPTFMEALATRVSGPPSLLRITLVMDQGVRYNTGAGHNTTTTDSSSASNSSSSEFLLCLERFAKFMGLHVEINTVIGPLQSFNQAALGLQPGEALGVCAQFRLHALSEEVGSSSSSSNLLSPRDSFLRVLRLLNPLALVLSENDVDHLSPDFPTRFAQVTGFFWKFFESNGASYKGKSSEERQIIEYEAAMAMFNTVACDGLTRIERNEPHAGWVARLRRAGFSAEPISEDVLDNSRSLLRKYDSHWELLVDMECAVLLWKNQPVTFCSVWTCS